MLKNGLMRGFRHVTQAVVGLLLAGSLPICGARASEVNLYTTREPGLIQPLLDAFAAEQKIKVNTIFVRDGLPERLAAEGSLSPADVLMTVDLGNLVDLVDKSLTQSITSDVLTQAIPANLRDEAGHWFSLSLRSRVVYAARDRVTADVLTYEELADPKWKGKVCTRSGRHSYNTALIAAVIAKHGEPYAEKWLRGLKANLARKPGGGDRDVARDILGGLCDLGLGNSYYVGLMRSGKGGEEQVKWGRAIKVIQPAFAGGGTHVNVSGAALAKHAPNRANGIKLLEYLVSDQAQESYAKLNYEYPVKAGVALDPLIAELGLLQVDPAPIIAIVRNRKAASTLVDKTGFDD